MNLLPCCCAACEPTPTPVLRFLNVTMVTDYSSTPNPAGIAPYGRDHDYCAVGACVDAESNSECGGTDQIKCWTMGFDGASIAPLAALTGINECTGGALVSQIAQNCYASDGTTLQEFPSHCTYGWKAVAAIARWHGQTGFLDDPTCCPTGGDSQVLYKSQTLIEEGTRTRAVNQTNICVDPDSYINFSYYHKINQTASCDDCGNVSRTGDIHFRLSQSTTANPEETWLDSCQLADCTGSFDVMPAQFPLAASCGIISVGYALGDPNHGLFPSVQGTAAELNAMNLKAQSSSSGTLAGGMAFTIVATGSPAVFTVTDDTLSVEWNSVVTTNYISRNDCGLYPDDYDYEEVVTTNYRKVITLGNANTWASVQARAATMLAEYSLTDDRIYPWRTDAQTWLVPLITQGGEYNYPSISLGQTGSCPRTTIWGETVTCESCEFAQDTGRNCDIIGAPLPPGYGYHFNYWHKNWIDCNAGIDCGQCIETYGAMGASPLPMNATQWTDKIQGWDMPGRGAHISQIDYAGAPTRSALVQKWAETIVKWPSINFARPASRDRYLFDETDVACGSVAGTDLTLSVAPTTPFSAGNKIAAGSGVYQITGGSGLAYTVSALLYDTPIPCDGASRLRYPTARAIMSTLAATAVQTSPGLVTVTTTEKHRLKAGGSEQDTVTLTGIGGLTTAVATVTSDTVFTVSGTLTTSPSSGTISDGATSAQIAFDTTCSRNTFLAREWQSDFSNPGDPWSVTETEVTLAPIARHPTVLYSSPNDTFPHGYSIPWGSIAANMCDGAAWSARFDQVIVDPFWQADHEPCGHAGAWSQDDTPCHAPDSDHYAFPPLVEARATTPSGAPTIPVTFFTAESESMPAPLSHPNCDINPYTQGHAMSWYSDWLTCTDWEELIGAKC